MSPAPVLALTPQDAGYLRRETDDQPMHIVLLMWVAPGPDGPLTLDKARRQIGGRLHLCPELRQVPRRAPAGVGPIVLVDDRHFDLDRHVGPWPVTATDPAAVASAMAELASRRLDPRRPLWRLQVGPSDARGHVPVALSVHHAIADGGRLVLLTDALFPADAADSRSPGWSPRRGPGRARLLAIGMSRRIRDRVRPGGTGVAPGAAQPIPARPVLSGPVSASRAVALRRLPMSEVRELRQASGATINDLFLTAVAHAMRALLPSTVGHERLKPQELLALVPRDVRTATDSTGNRTWSMYVPLPVGALSARERLAQVSAATTQAKSATRSAGNAAFDFDVTATNVRFGGPHRLGGGEIESIHATGPLQGRNRLVVLATSTVDWLALTVVSDGLAFPDAESIADAVVAGFHLLERDLEVASDVE